MNLVGKIFTVLILVFSIFFAAFAVAVYATHKNWMVAALGKSKELAAEVVKLGELKQAHQKEKDTWTTEKNAAVEVHAKLEQEAKEFKDERDKLAEQKKKLDEQLTAATADVATSHAELKHLRTQVEGLNTEIRQANKDRDAHFAKVVALTDELNQLANEVSRLKELQKDLSEQYAKLRTVAMKHKLKLDPTADAANPPDIEGVVTGVAGDGLVEISIGADDGLIKGHLVEVYRPNGTSNTYVGRIEVQRTAPDRAVCKTIPSSMKSQIQKGDRVATKLQ